MGGEYEPGEAPNPGGGGSRELDYRGVRDGVSELSPGRNTDEIAELIYHYRKVGASYNQTRKLLLEDHNLDLSLELVVGYYRNYQAKLTALVGGDSREHAFYMEMERLDSMQSAVWDQALAGDQKAIELVLKIIAMRSKLYGLDQLNGLDRNAQMNVLIVGQDKEAFINALRSGQGSLTGSSRDDEEDVYEGEP